MSDKGLVSVIPPVPLATVISPAFLSLVSIFLIMTGFVLILLAKKSLVILYSPLKVSTQVNMCSATVNLLDICISLPPEDILYLINCNIDNYN